MLLTENEIEGILKKCLPKDSEEDIHHAAEAITVAKGKWREVDLAEDIMGAEMSVQCKDICVLGKAFDDGLRIRAFVTEKDVRNQQDEE